MTPLRLPDGRTLPLDRPVVMGILNLTPDSFSDGGRYTDEHDALHHAARMIADGAAIIDVGGESTRPGAQRVPAEQQKTRVLGLIRRLRDHVDRNAPHAAISIDTTLAPVAAAALDAGAHVINDVSAATGDPQMLTLAAQRGAPLVLMHMRGRPADMQTNPQYHDVTNEVRAYLLARAAAAENAGVPPTQIIIDPGIGFGKTAAHNLTLLARLDALVATGYPVLIGASRKQFIDHAAAPNTHAADPAGRLGGTCAVTALAVAAGAHVLRVHDVAPNRQAADVAHAIRCAARDQHAPREHAHPRQPRAGA